MQVEVDATERAFFLGLAQNDGDVLVQRDAMPQVGTAVRVGLDRLFHERVQGRLAVLREFFQANDVFVVSSERGGNLWFERLCGHGEKLRNCRGKFNHEFIPNLHNQGQTRWQEPRLRGIAE